jgi:hypothetical protein
MPSPAERNRALNGLTAKMRREFTAIWMRLNLNNPDTLRDPLAVVLAEIADKYGTAAAALAADFYDDMRENVVRSGPRFTPKLAEVPKIERFQSLAGWGIGPLFGANPDPATALHKVTGGLQLVVADAYRDTMMESSIADPAARGWQRVADANACAFCQMLEGRGEVYSQAGADFAAHDACGCSAEPAFEGEPVPVRPFTPSERNISDADRTRVRDWIKANPNG